jgi:hypothetical protein
MSAVHRYARAGAPDESARLARYVSDLLVPAVSKATLDLWVATDQLSSWSYTHHTYVKTRPYEVTIVQHMIEVMAAHGTPFGTPVWEVGFKATTGAGRPTSVDVVLEDADSTLHSKHALLEFGAGQRFSKQKIDADLKKLKVLTDLGTPITGIKQMHFVSVTTTKSKGYTDYFNEAKKAVTPTVGRLVFARRFPIYRPDTWEYVAVGSYEVVC